MNSYFEFCLMFFVFMVWNVNTHRIFRRLKAEHIDKYREMGEPGIFINNNFSTTAKYMKFIFKYEWKKLNDPILNRMCYLMPILLIVFTVAIFRLNTTISFAVP